MTANKIALAIALCLLLLSCNVANALQFCWEKTEEYTYKSVEEQWRKDYDWTKIGLYSAASAAVAYFAIPAAIAGAGFTTAGITKGSLGAWLMSFYGGATPAGGIVASLQALGAGGVTGWTAVTSGLTAGAGATFNEGIYVYTREIRRVTRYAKRTMKVCGVKIGGYEVPVYKAITKEEL